MRNRAQVSFNRHTYEFLEHLENHNNKVWFDGHKDDFERNLLDPALMLCDELNIWFDVEKLPFYADAKKNGGSLSRIHRDSRFSEDKTPYHTHFHMRFRHRDFDAKAIQPVLGLRIDKESFSVAAGVMGAGTTELNRIRDHILKHPRDWQEATKDLELFGDQLKTAPKGYDKDHLLIDDIRRKEYLARHRFRVEDLYGPTLLVKLQKAWKPMFPFTNFLADALQTS